MAKPISENERIIAGLRPMRSPMRPMTMPPMGRVTKPTPKVPSDASRLAVGEVDGKECAADIDGEK